MTYTEVLEGWRALVKHDPDKLKLLEVLYNSAVNPSFDAFARIMPDRSVISMTFDSDLASFQCIIRVRFVEPAGCTRAKFEASNTTSALLGAMEGILLQYSEIDR